MVSHRAYQRLPAGPEDDDDDAFLKAAEEEEAKNAAANAGHHTLSILTTVNTNPNGKLASPRDLSASSGSPADSPAKGRLIRLVGVPDPKETPEDEDAAEVDEKTQLTTQMDDDNGMPKPPAPGLFSGTYDEQGRPIVDVLDSMNEDPFTLETFENMIRLSANAGKDFILARVTTADPDDTSRFYYSYYAAHHINKVLFRTQPEEGLLHRMRAKNPLNNMVIVGDVHYYAIRALSVNIARITNDRRHKSVTSLVSKTSGSVRTSPDLEAALIRRQSDLFDQPPTPTFLNSPSIRRHSPTGSLDENMGAAVRARLSAKIQRFLEYVSHGTTAAGFIQGATPKRKTLRLIMRPEALLEDETEDVLLSMLDMSGAATAKEGWGRRNSADDAFVVTHSTSPNAKKPQARRVKSSLGFKSGPAGRVGASPTSGTTWRKVRSTSYLNETQSGLTKLALEDWVRDRTQVVLMPAPQTGRRSSKESQQEEGRVDLLGDVEMSVVFGSSRKDQGKVGSMSSSPAKSLTAPPNLLYYTAEFVGTDDDFLMKASTRAIFKENALEMADAVLFTISNGNGEEDHSQHPALANFVYAVEEGDDVRLMNSRALRWIVFGYGVIGFVVVRFFVPSLYAFMTEVRKRKVAGAKEPTDVPAVDEDRAITATAAAAAAVEEKKRAAKAAAAAAAVKDAEGAELKLKLIAEAKARVKRESLMWNVCLAFVALASFLTRAYRIDHPNQVVFDEVHFGKFASYYLRREYYFDVHPPLGKLLLAATGMLAGYDGHFLFENIGDDYIANHVPYIALRLLPATCGAMVVPLSFCILKEIGISIWGALFGSFLLILGGFRVAQPNVTVVKDISLISQSRLILLDSMLMMFGVWSVYNWIRFHKERHTVKMVGLFTIASVGIAVLVDLWRLLDWQRNVSNREFIRHFAARALCLIFLPIAIYLSFFYIHFEILTFSGPGDAFMSPAFQAELKGSDVASNSLAIPYSSLISIKHRESSGYLHSHVDRYPLRYDDGRISSQGQQVTSYPHRDPNNMWEVVPVNTSLFAADIKPLTSEELEKGIRYVRHNDIVQLMHVNTKTYLRTHDVASPLTTTNMEVTTISADADDYATSYVDTLWRLEITDGEPSMKIRSRRNHFRILSVPHKVAVHVNKDLLPDWGFGQAEINGNKNQLESSNVFYADEVVHERIVNGTEIGETKETKKEIKRVLPFLSKFFELQSLMISHNAGLTTPHPYSSTPATWPFVIRGISFWEVKDGLKQIYLIGNPLVWWTAITGTLMYMAMWILDRILLRRGIDDFGPAIRRWWDRSIGFLVVAWALHWLPFFLMGRMLFLHHYLPSFIFSTLVATALIEFVGRVVMEDPVKVAGGDVVLAERIPYKAWMRRRTSVVYVSVLVALLGAYTWAFVYFAPLCYGNGFEDVEQIRARKWLKSWDLQHA
ncbi:hypothetical protein HK101_010497 [Irineochytrium annulatum]|nr:hypothetical protein HK101_010497 [Irineochytrium annulatum]